MQEGIAKIAKAFLLEEEFKEAVQTAEDKFVRSLVKIMGKDNSQHHYRKLGADIFCDLTDKAGAPWQTDEFEKGFAKFERLIQNDKILYAIIKEERPKYSDEKIRWIMKAFRKSYSLGHFGELESEFGT